MISDEQGRLDSAPCAHRHLCAYHPLVNDAASNPIGFPPSFEIAIPTSYAQITRAPLISPSLGRYSRRVQNDLGSARKAVKTQANPTHSSPVRPAVSTLTRIIVINVEVITDKDHRLTLKQRVLALPSLSAFLWGACQSCQRLGMFHRSIYRGGVWALLPVRRITITHIAS